MNVTTVTVKLELTQDELSQLLAGMAGNRPKTRAEGMIRLSVLRKLIAADAVLSDEQKRGILELYDSLEKLANIGRKAWN